MTLDEPVNEALISEVISAIFKQSKVKPEIRFERGSKVGEGFLGITSSVQVKFNEDVHHLFVKMLPQNEKIRRTLSLMLVFDREVCFYLELYPILNEIFTTHLNKSFELTPKCKLVKTEHLKEAIVFDNIATRGYSTKEASKPLDKDHLLLTLKTYSYLHAGGFLFKRDYPDKFQTMAKSKPDLFFKVIDVYDLKKVAIFCLDVLSKHCSDIEDKDILDNFREIEAKTTEVRDYVSNVADFSTTIHIDCWKNNLMFKYKNDSNELEDLKLVDMQMWTINSPVFDILHVIYVNVPTDGNLDLLDFYFDYYYNSLSKVILEMGGNSEILYPRNAYLSHLKKYSFYGFFIACIVLKTLLNDPEDMPNVAQAILQNKSLTEVFIQQLPDEEGYCQRLKTVLRHLLRNNML